MSKIEILACQDIRLRFEVELNVNTKDYMMLLNSDFLKERRGGLRINVSEAEIADMAKKGGEIEDTSSKWGAEHDEQDDKYISKHFDFKLNGDIDGVEIWDEDGRYQYLFYQQKPFPILLGWAAPAVSRLVEFR